MNGSHKSNKLFLLISTHKGSILGKILGLIGGKHSYIHGPAIAAKKLWTPNGMCTSFLADTLPKQASSTVFDPPQVSNADARERHIQPKVYIHDALPEEPNGFGTAHPEQTKAQTWRCMDTWNLFSVRRRALQPFKISLHVPRPSQSPRVDEPHLASIASTRSAVAGSARKCVAQVVRDSAGVTYGNHRKLAEDTLKGYDVQDRFRSQGRIPPESQLIPTSLQNRASNYEHNCNNTDICQNSHIVYKCHNRNN
jgi:hypothetical protein